MVYIKDTLYKNPDNENIKIWRYFSLQKFLSLLDKKSLFFCRLDKLPDIFEGVIPKPNIDHFNEKEQSEIRDYVFKIRKLTTINCWYMNEIESAAMWSIYANKGVAIQSTFKHLMKSFDVSKEEVRIGTVDYIDYNYKLEKNLIMPVLFKRKSFEYEKELRVIIQNIPEDKKTKQPRLDDKAVNYVSNKMIDKNIDVNLPVLIDKIVLYPGSHPWFKNLIENIINLYYEKYGFETKPIIEQSILDEIY